MAKVFNSPSKYVQGPDALSDLGGFVARLGSKALVLITASGKRRVGDKIEAGFASVDAVCVFEEFGGECSKNEVARLRDVVAEKGCDVIVGVGGGKTLDTAKAVAFYESLPVAICPTIASSDAPCSALSVLYTDDGAFDEYLFLPSNPNLVLMDTTVIAATPVRLTVSGMGDALATYFEARACVNSDADTCAGGKSTLAAYALAKLCYETLLEDGLKAKIALDAGANTSAVDHIVEANTLLSGIGFESCGLAGAHAIHNGLTLLPETHELYHGEKVAFGTLTQLVLEDVPTDELEEVLDFCCELGLPVTFAQVGIEDPTPEKLMTVAQGACAEGDTMGNMPFEVTPQMVVDALKGADALGRAALA